MGARVRRWQTVACLVVTVILSMVAGVEARQMKETRDVVFSASGGISKGAYQGGLDWTISEFLRRQREDDLRRQLGIPHAITFRLRSVTGASAGNIDALFAAIGWCTKKPKADDDTRARRTQPGVVLSPVEILPEESLFWQAWIPTGLTELSHKWDGKGPLEPSTGTDAPDDLAALQRRLFYDAHRPAIRKFMEGAVPYDDKGVCALPVGLTLTKVTPVDVRLKGDLGQASVQRFASVFRVASVQGQLDFSPPAAGERVARLGALALLPTLENQARTSFGERLDDVFRVILASSAFPLAFAPVKLRYQPGGLIQWAGGSNYPSDLFADGGVFDNNPLGLAHELGEAADDRQPRVAVAYSSPGNYRNGLHAGKAKVSRAEQAGLGSAVQLLAGAFESARDYELQAFSRVIAEDPDDPVRHRAASTKGRPVDLMLSSRSTPIYGETAASFGAFLGRPLREYDFYAGVYDGLEFVARHFLCAHKPPKDKGAVDTCAAEHHARLVQDDVFHLGPTGGAVTKWLLARERTKQTPEPIDPKVNPKLFLLQKLHHALEARQLKTCDPRLDIVQQTLCEGGLAAPMAKLAEERDEIVAAAKSLLGPKCPKLSPVLEQCEADDAFIRLLESPERALYAAMEDALVSIDNAESTVQERVPDAQRYLLPLNFASALFGSQTLRYRTGFSINNSTAKRMWKTHTTASIASLILPNYVQTIRSKDVSNDPLVLGWTLASQTFSNGMYWNVNPEWAFQDRRWDVGSPVKRATHSWTRDGARRAGET